MNSCQNIFIHNRYTYGHDFLVQIRKSATTFNNLTNMKFQVTRLEFGKKCFISIDCDYSRWFRRYIREVQTQNNLKDKQFLGCETLCTEIFGKNII